MEFTLYYHGELRSNGDVRHKHQIRKEFHKQLQVLWKQHPLNLYQSYLLKEQHDSWQPETDIPWVSLIFPQKQFEFAALISEKLNLHAELEVFMLQPAEPGKILTQAADIDNRLKTLFDALQKPDDNQIPEDEPEEGENPFLCVLENDSLITNVSIRTGRLLEPVEHSSEVRLFIHIKVRRTQFTLSNADFA